jgi:hypothetical protein
MQQESKGIQSTELESGTPYDILAGVEGGILLSGTSRRDEPPR